MIPPHIHPRMYPEQTGPPRDGGQRDGAKVSGTEAERNVQGGLADWGCASTPSRTPSTTDSSAPPLTYALTMSLASPSPSSSSLCELEGEGKWRTVTAKKSSHHARKNTDW